MDLFYGLAEVIVRFMDSGPGFLASLLYLAIAVIPVTVLHELRLGQISLSVDALSHPSKAAGLAQFDDSRATAHDVLLIALAGPAASLAGTVLTAWALSTASPAGVLHDLLWAATLAGVFGVLNLVPLTFKERRDGPSVQTDGRLALDALRVARALR